MSLRDFFSRKKYKNQEKEAAAIRSEVMIQIDGIETGSMAQLRIKYAEMYKNLPLEENMILYEAYAGRGLICSPYAIFKRFTQRDDFKDYIHVWSLEDIEKQKDTIERYAGYDNVIFVQRDTLEYCEYLAKTKYLISNLSFPNYYTKKAGQIYINTWHGIPLKTLGFDIPDGRITGLNTIRNFLAVDVFLSPNRFMTERFKYAFRLEGLFEGKIMESGMPRNDNFFNTDRDEVLSKLEAAGVSVDPSKKIIMYAPTWKGEKYSNPDTSTKQYFELIDAVEKNVNTDEYQILVKPHQIVYKNIVDKGEVLTDKFIPATIDANEIMSVVDVMISDYSSIYFDYLASGRPILFYISDLKEYKEQRGLYFGIDKLPGPIAETLDELGKMVSDIPAAISSMKEKYDTEKEWACSHDDGNVCERVIDKIIVKQDFSGLISCDHTSKKKLIMYSGGLKPGKLRDKLDKFISEFDFDKNDLTLIVPHTESDEIFEWIRNVDSRVRVLRRTGTHAADVQEKENMEIVAKHGRKDPDYEAFYSKYYPRQAFERELMRIAGQTHFDYAIDFSEKSEYFRNVFECLEDAEIIDRTQLDIFKK